MDYEDIQCTGIRFVAVRRFKGPFFIDEPEMMTHFWRIHVESAAWFCPEKECVVCVVVDTLFQVKAFHLVAIGTLDGVLFGPREILRPAVLVNGARVVVLHNHPSGDPLPSFEDTAVTTRLIEAGEILGIQILDHVIIGEGTESRYSFRENQPELFGIFEEDFLPEKQHRLLPVMNG
jgi:DNA repair protein RadC